MSKILDVNKSDIELKSRIEALYNQGLLSTSPKQRLKELQKIREQVPYWKKGKKTQQLLKIFKALANKNRLLIFVLVSQGVRCSCEIESLLGLSQSTVSHHLNILVDAGIIEAERIGKWTFVHTKAEGLTKEFFIDLFSKVLK